MQTLKNDILIYFPKTIFPRQVKGGLDAVLRCVDVKLSASLKEILNGINVNIPANDSDDDRPLIRTKRASRPIASSDDDEIITKEKALRSNDVTTNVQVNKKSKILDTTTAPSTISDRSTCLIRPWIEKQKKKIGQ